MAHITFHILDITIYYIQYITYSISHQVKYMNAALILKAEMVGFVTQRMWLGCHTADIVSAQHSRRAFCVSRTHICCVAQQTHLLCDRTVCCDAADMSAMSRRMRIYCVEAHETMAAAVRQGCRVRKIPSDL